MLTIRHYKKAYNGTLILSVDALTFEPGVYWIKGGNGAGKSTLFKSIAGIIPFEGEIRYGDTGVKEHSVRYRMMVNYAEAEPQFPGFLTAKDLVRFIGTAKGAGRQQQDLYANIFGIDRFFEKPCETYSSGMLKKLSIALAFLGNPKVIILDEPLITLDAEARKALLGQVRAVAEAGVTLLLSSHQALDDVSLDVKGEFTLRDRTLHHG